MYGDFLSGVTIIVISGQLTLLRIYVLIKIISNNFTTISEQEQVQLTELSLHELKLTWINENLYRNEKKTYFYKSLIAAFIITLHYNTFFSTIHAGKCDHCFNTDPP